MKPRVLFLFGAGASRFCGPCHPGNPPLGDALFEALAAREFFPQGLPEPCLQTFRSTTRFELGMACLEATLDSSVYNPFLRAMARFFAVYAPMPGNFYIELFTQLNKKRCRFRVATLNYENLIESALGAAGCVGRVIKLHGSCGFLPDFGTNTFTSLVSVGSGAGDFNFPIQRVWDAKAIDEWCSGPGQFAGLAPVMSFYTPTKKTQVSSHIVREERNIWKDYCSWHDVCFVVGVACNPDDEHVWAPLAQSKARVIYVNPRDDGFDAWRTGAKRPDDQRIPEGFRDAIPEIVASAASAR